MRGVQRDGPNQICSQRRNKERDVHDMKERKEEERVGEKTATDDELQMPADK